MPSELPDFSTATGQQLRLLRVAILKTATPPGLSMLLSDYFDKDWVQVAVTGTFEEQIFELLRGARAEGWLNELIRATLERWPKAPALLNVVQTYSLTAVEVPPQLASRPPPHGMAAPLSPSAAKADLAQTAGQAEQSNPGPLERIIARQTNFLEPIAWVDALASVRNRVCRLGYGDKGFGTGCLIAPDLVLTCWHNLIDSLGAPVALFDFALDGAEVRPGRQLPAAANWHVVSEPYNNGAGLNFSVIRLAEPVGHELLPDGEPRGWISLRRGAFEGSEGEALAVVHHPRAGPMMMSLGARLADYQLNPHRLHHNAETAPGSSGAGCFNFRLDLIGLHEGKFGDPRSSKINRAIRIEAIIARLNELHPAVLAQSAESKAPTQVPQANELHQSDSNLQ